MVVILSIRAIAAKLSLRRIQRNRANLVEAEREFGRLGASHVSV